MANLRMHIDAQMAGNIKTPSVLQLLVMYSRVIRRGAVDANGARIRDEVGPATRQFALSDHVAAAVTIEDYAADTPVTLAVTDGQGHKLLTIGEKKPAQNNGSDEWTLKQTISGEEVERLIKASTPLMPVNTPVMSAKAEFKPTIDKEIQYNSFSLVVSAIDRTTISDATLAKYSLERTGTTSAVLNVGPNSLLGELRVAAVTSIPVSLQGQFEFTIPRESNDSAWVWVLSGAQSFVGLVDASGESVAMRRVLWLPFKEGELAEEERSPPPVSIPIDPSEQELLQNPELFSDDPGTKCKPFSSPHRIVGERAFQTVLRVTQPEISRDEAAPKPPRPFDITGLRDIDASSFTVAADPGNMGGGTPRRQPAGNSPHTLSRYSLIADISALSTAVTTVPGGRPADTTLSPEEEVLAEVRADILRDSQGRRVLGSGKALDWEDNTPPQAASLSYGHILEYRVRWRNNGYSLGDVLYSLPLAPRQAKKIVTVSSRIVDRARRIESTTASEEIAQGTTRDYGYTDAVEAGLSEWSKGGSRSSQTGAAGGVGLAIGPVVLGGGASHGQAASSSWQEGGRAVSAREQQTLNDAIRQYGESVRKLETVVVQEQSQEETTQAVSEVVRNPNYCHTLTIVYHEILRHLRVDTEVVGARECVFVPLPIRPFTLARMIRWRDSLTQVLMRPSLLWVMPYLEDVRDNFLDSRIPDGMRAVQPITFLAGSLYLRLAIERPQDNEDEGVYDQARWLALSPLVSGPVREIYERLKRNSDQKDQIFQRDYAPGIAARWVDRLTLAVNGLALRGVDFTLAGTYRFGRSVRVDFTCSPDRALTRNDLVKIVVGVEEGSDLTPGSIANLQRLSIRYTTQDFSREKASDRAERDLIKVDTGKPDPAGAETSIPLDDWEKQNQRAIIRAQTDILRRHLNEHLEHYHKHLWWNLDRDKLYMLLDTIYAVSEQDGRSVASVVERNPLAILGNSLVYRVAGGAHLGIDGHKSAQDLNSYYTDSVPRGAPIRVSLPTAGVYAQALLDDCEACEEHFGSTEWILDDQEPELAGIDPSMLGSRRVSAPDLTPSQLPTSIINLQNAPNVPNPSGVGGVLSSVTNADSFRDMAGLAGTQANSRAAMDTAAQLATTFGTQAAEIRKQEIAAKLAKERLDVIKKAVDKGLASPEEGQVQAQKVLDNMTEGAADPQPLTLQDSFKEKIRGASSVKASKASPSGLETLEINAGGDGSSSDASDGADDSERLPGGSVLEEGTQLQENDAFAWVARHAAGVTADPNFETSTSLFEVTAFAGDEHGFLGEGVQRMIDEWARHGLVAGGAFIDTKKHLTSDERDKPIDDWDVFTPEVSSPTNPYPTLQSEGITHAHWHYIVDDTPAGTDPDWTRMTLKAALKNGDAVALSIKHIILLAGDLYASFDALTGRDGRGKGLRPTVNAMHGIDEGEPWAYGILSLKAFPDFDFQVDKLGQLDLLEGLASPMYPQYKAAIANGSSQRFKRTANVVDFLRRVRGNTNYSEAHILARVLEEPDAISAKRLIELAPWFKGNDNSGLKTIRNELVEIIVSDGNYLDLALNNKNHFAPDNWDEFSIYQRLALEAIETHAASSVTSTAPIPADAIALCAFGMHFLTDAFSSGHMRVPRVALGQVGGVGAKLMHDFDNMYGLVVKNGFGDKWRAFGDNYLFGPRDSVQLDIMDKIRALPDSAGISKDSIANLSMVLAAVGSAFKQLHYEAERIGLSPARNANFEPALANARESASKLKWENLVRGEAHDDPDFAVRVQKSIAEKLDYMKKHEPTPEPVGQTHAQNHPVLFAKQNSVALIPAGTPYRWYDTMTSLGADRTLLLRWHGNTIEIGFSDLWQFERNIRGNTPSWLPALPDRIYKLVENGEVREETNIIGL